MNLSLLKGPTTLGQAARAVFNISVALCVAISPLTPPCSAQGGQPSGLAAAVPGQIGVLHGAVTKFKGDDSGSLAVLDPKTGKPLGKCPLKHTSVSAEVSGYVSRVTVKQLFENPFKDKIEAVYTFPLSETGAVDEMLMKVGARTIRGTIKRREEARNIYEAAKARGHVASLLDQERPNIFTQSVANIKPGEKVEITLRYVDLLAYEDGSFTFAFPTVVGPRFNPGAPTGKQGTGWSPDTSAVPDASKITPPVTAEGTRAGHDISIEVSIDAGVPIHGITSKLHDVTITRPARDHALVMLKNKQTIPNKDFVLSWEVASDQLQSGYLTHRTGQSGYFTIMLLPPKRVTPDKVAPKEMIFLIDCSGSQSGAPLQKAKETMNYILDHMNPQDTFQIISFNNQLKILFEKPELASASMKEKAQKFIESLAANGGTWMAPAVEKACSIPADAHRLRIVTFMTDGYVGNDFEILGMVRKLRGTSRWFPFGTGNSVNRMLIDGMAKEGGGESEYVLLNSPGNEVGRKFYERISSPVLTDVKVDFDGLEVKEVFPHEISDVWAQRPLYIKGRYTKPGKGTITLSGFAGGKPYAQKLQLVLPEKEPAHGVIASIWARAKVDRLMGEDYFGAQRGAVNKELKEEIIKTALDHHIMTQYTSFVAVEETVITDGGKARTVVVPVEMPDGVSYKGVFGKEEGVATRRMAYNQAAQMASPSPAPMLRAYGGGGGYGAGSPIMAYGHAPAISAQGTAAGGRARFSFAPSVRAEHAQVKGDSLHAMSASTTGAGVREEEGDEAVLPTATDKSEPLLKHKLDPSLRNLIDKYAKTGANGQIGGIEVANGKVMIEISLTDVSEKVIRKLKELGLEIVSQSPASKTVIGRIPVLKVELLARLDAVRRVAPAR
ncbi:MAG TPA: VIT and VWA domain-containing protein [Candidatus Obscuribacterales bacterium]